MQDLTENRREGLQSWLSPKWLGEDPVPAFLLQDRPQYGTGLRQLRVGVIHSVRDKRWSALRGGRLLHDDRRSPILGVVQDQDDSDQKAGADELRQVEWLVEGVRRRGRGDEGGGHRERPLSDRREGCRCAAQGAGIKQP